jgi:DNA-binding Xre family transcriptional regulator
MRREVKLMEVSYKKLWKLLIDKDLKKRDLSRVADIGTSTIAKMTRGEHVSMDVLLKICKAFNCDFGDIIEAVPTNKE